jgi:hypothetical protein
MIDDPIVEEVRRIRDRQAGELDYDLDKIFRDLKHREKLFTGKLVRRPNPKLDNSPKE